jgi:hypothetical protein
MTEKQKNEILEQMLEERSKGKKVLSNPAKKITLSILVIAFIIGIIGATPLEIISVENYISFLDSFQWYFSMLILSIGGGTVADKVVKGFGKEKKDD